MDKNEYANIYKNETSFWWYKVLHHLVDSTVRKRAKVKKIKILDAGCGTGRMMEMIGKYGDIEGFDYSEDAILCTKARGINQAYLQDLNLWEGQKKYDLIISLDVLYHSGIKDDIAIIKQFFKSLENDGILILNLAAFEILRRPHDIVVHTQRRYRKRKLVGEMKKIGFKIERASYRMPHLFLIILLSKMFKNKQNTDVAHSDLNEIPKWLNKLLFLLGIIENKWILKVGTIPFGSSLFIVAKK